MGMYKYLREIWKKPKENNSEMWKARLVAWRKEPVTVRLDKPTRLDRARSLGYKAKQGIIVVRQRVIKGGRKRPDIKKGRSPKKQSQRLDLDKNYQRVAEERAHKKYLNCEVLNSYWVAEDGRHKWYEIILVDREHPVILKTMKGVSKQRGRVARGLTSAGKKSRGLRKKGTGAEKVRPSIRANKGRLH